MLLCCCFQAPSFEFNFVLDSHKAEALPAIAIGLHASAASAADDGRNNT